MPEKDERYEKLKKFLEDQKENNKLKPFKGTNVETGEPEEIDFYPKKNDK